MERSHRKPLKRYINVAYKDREMAKRLGARWDASVKRWYCPPGSALAKIYSWRKTSNVGMIKFEGEAPSAATLASVNRAHKGDQLSLLA